jgi:hypothetical protein
MTPRHVLLSPKFPGDQRRAFSGRIISTGESLGDRQQGHDQHLRRNRVDMFLLPQCRNDNPPRLSGLLLPRHKTTEKAGPGTTDSVRIAYRRSSQIRTLIRGTTPYVRKPGEVNNCFRMYPPPICYPPKSYFSVTRWQCRGDTKRLSWQPPSTTNEVCYAIPTRSE